MWYGNFEVYMLLVLRIITLGICNLTKDDGNVLNNRVHVQHFYTSMDNRYCKISLIDEAKVVLKFPFHDSKTTTST